MRLFHVSENHEIESFKPRILDRRSDVEQRNGLVWAVNEEKLYNLMFPTDCPRLSVFKGEDPNFLKGDDPDILIIMEKDWLERMIDCSLTIYEFETSNFYLQDYIAGYYVSEQEEKILSKVVVENCYDYLVSNGFKILLVDTLHEMKDKIMNSTNNFSFRKLIYAKK